MGKNVKELLEELKNVSELMLDLAYSAVFFESKDIAREVILLSDSVSKLEEDLYLHLFAISKKMSKRLISVIELVETSKKVAAAAKNLGELVLEGKELHPVIKVALKETDESIVRVKISKNSIMANKTLGELKFRSNTGLDVIAIRRRKKWIFDPKKNTRIYPGDVIIAVGSLESCRRAKDIANGKIQEL
ncbi:MAG: PhoU family transcriptional regulator [Candidatus Aenigmarchaeota archaeon]|nr:PhoU family transcriptional regulator [Candidatus Aenigmarchaeota archaeon]